MFVACCIICLFIFQVIPLGFEALRTASIDMRLAFGGFGCGGLWLLVQAPKEDEGQWAQWAAWGEPWGSKHHSNNVYPP